MCCVVQLSTSKMEELVKMYHRKHWLDKKGESMPALCHISKIKVAETGTNSDSVTRVKKVRLQNRSAQESNHT